MADLMKRLPHVVVDEYGVDPLRDRSLDLIDTITAHRTVFLEDMYANNAPLLSYDEYGTIDGWWIILAYNGIGRMSELTTGRRINLPDRTQVIRILSEAVDQKAGADNAFDTNNGAERVVNFREW